MSRATRAGAIRILAILSLLLATSITDGWSQICIPPSPCTSPPATSNEGSRWERHTLALGINMAIGGLSAGAIRAFKGESFRDAFLRGAAGGGLAYTGKFISTRPVSGATLIGRQTAALGAAVTRNAITGADTFERLSFPLGPIFIHHESGRTWFTVDLPTVAGAIYGMTRDGARFDTRRSLATGAIVFEVEKIRSSRADQLLLGNAIAGTILYRPDPRFQVPLADIIGHETIHLIQHDYGAIAFGSPFEEWGRGRLAERIAGPLSHLELGSHLTIRLLPVLFGVDSRKMPWEVEAHFLIPERP